MKGIAPILVARVAHACGSRTAPPARAPCNRRAAARDGGWRRVPERGHESLPFNGLAGFVSSLHAALEVDATRRGLAPRHRNVVQHQRDRHCRAHVVYEFDYGRVLQGAGFL